MQYMVYNYVYYCDIVGFASTPRTIFAPRSAAIMLSSMVPMCV
jgi:hypothetical protein